jgi:hypothetical protein
MIEAHPLAPRAPVRYTLNCASRSFPAGLIAAALIAMLIAACRTGNRAEVPVCPPGDTLVGAPPPRGSEVFCQRIIGGKTVKNGPFIVYADGGGKLIEGHYRDGVQEGEWTMWYQNGQRSAVDRYHDGLQEGPHVSWYANGQIAIEGMYHAGKREGRWTRWDPSGLISRRTMYRDGEPIPQLSEAPHSPP